MFNALTAVKFVATGLVGLGTNKIVKGVIKAHVEEPKNLLDKVEILSAAFVISGVVATATRSYTDESIDKIADGAAKVIDKFKEDAKLAKVNTGKATWAEVELDETDYVKNDKGLWVRRKKSETEILEEKLERINTAQSNFAKEGLDRDHFRQNDLGQWVAIPTSL